MGLESLPNINPDLFSWAKDLETVQREMEARGWNETNFGFNLGRHSGALDIRYDDLKRVLVYTPCPKDKNGQVALEAFNLPRLPVLNLANYKPTTLIVADLPLTTRALDSMSFTDQQPVTSHIGSVEILQAVGGLVGQVWNKTQMLPESFRLKDLALTQGHDDIIKLVPPLTLTPVSLVTEKFVEYLGDDLKAQDPKNNHDTQIAAMIEAFRQAISIGK